MLTSPQIQARRGGTDRDRRQPHACTHRHLASYFFLNSMEDPTVDLATYEPVRDPDTGLCPGELGRGHFGAVVLYRKDGVEYAVKMLERPSPGDEYEQEALLLLAQQRCRNVVSYMGSGYVGDTRFLVFERCYESLRTCINRRLREAAAPFEEASVRCWLGQILTGVAAAHRAGVIHRDLKPENVVFHERAGDARGVDHVLKIVDFGLSVSAAQSRRTHGKGTPQYMAPELHNEEEAWKKHNTSVDVFAFGVLALELSTLRHCLDDKKTIGKAMVCGRSKKEIHERNVKRVHMQVTEKLDGGTCKDLTPLVLACLAYDRDARPSAKALLPHFVPGGGVEGSGA
eukprot:Rhum_TRINITY_DN2357_c0_g1::Rhum_TRINITY_DN2357_c0_g1_i1::g.6968::m.6968